MRVSLTTHGGQAAAINMRLPPRVVDSDRLPPGRAQELRRLVSAASAETGPVRTGPARDAMSYSITVEDGAGSTVLTGSDTAMSAAFAALLSWIEQHAE